MSRTVAVMGFGLTGRAVARILAAAGDSVVVFDDHVDEDARVAAAALGVQLQATPPAPDLAGRLGRCDLVVPSPGVPIGHPIYAAASVTGVPVRSEIELAAALARRQGGPEVLAITGTNGKTTVTTLAAAILNASGQRAVAAGNIGVPMIEAVEAEVDVVVAEVSSFQLQYTEKFRPSVSCWLNLAPDHLDWHPSMEHYAAAKARVWANQGPGDTAVVNADDPAVLSAAAGIPAGVDRRQFSVRRPADYRLHEGRLLGPGGVELVGVADLVRALPHDVANALAAAAVALAGGASVAGCRKALREAGPLPHRVSLVGEAGGVRWYDDSKATTPASVLAAVAGFDSAVLIAGGRNKGLDLGALAGTVPPVHAAVAIGEAAEDVRRALAGRVTVRIAASMEEAVDLAAGLARPGDAVLLSPGCASFDWYPSYAARGDHFTSLIAARLDQRGAHADH